MGRRHVQSLLRRLHWRKNALGNQRLPVLNPERKVYPEDCYGRAPDGRSADEVGSLPPNMSVPRVASRVKESHDLIALGVDPRQICPLKRVTMVTCEGEVLGCRRPAMAFGDDMVDFEGDVLVLLGHPAILAARAGPAPNQSP
jgi:hypothetical protein